MPEKAAENPEPTFSIEQYLSEVEMRPLPTSFEELRDEALNFLLRIYAEKLSVAEFRLAYLYCKALKKADPEAAERMDEDVRSRIRKEIERVERDKKEIVKICERVRSINQGSWVNACKTLSYLLCAYLNKRGIEAKIKKMINRHWKVHTTVFGYIDPIEVMNFHRALELEKRELAN